MHQIVLRTAFPANIHFENDEERRHFVSRYLDLQAEARRHGHRFVVGPRQTFITHSGTVLIEGDPIEPTQVFRHVDEHTLAGTHRTVPVWRQLEAAIAQSRIIVGVDEPEPPRAA